MLPQPHVPDTFDTSAELVQIPSSELFEWDVVEPPRHSGFMYQARSAFLSCLMLSGPDAM